MCGAARLPVPARTVRSVVEKRPSFHTLKPVAHFRLWLSDQWHCLPIATLNPCDRAEARPYDMRHPLPRHRDQMNPTRRTYLFLVAVSPWRPVVLAPLALAVPPRSTLLTPAARSSSSARRLRRTVLIRHRARRSQRLGEAAGPRAAWRVAVLRTRSGADRVRVSFCAGGTSHVRPHGGRAGGARGAGVCASRTQAVASVSTPLAEPGTQSGAFPASHGRSSASSWRILNAVAPRPMPSSVCQAAKASRSTQSASDARSWLRRSHRQHTMLGRPGSPRHAALVQHGAA